MKIIVRENEHLTAAERRQIPQAITWCRKNGMCVCTIRRKTYTFDFSEGKGNVFEPGYTQFIGWAPPTRTHFTFTE